MRSMFRSTTALTLLALAGWILATPAATFADHFPQPSVYPVSWELTFKHGAPRRIVVEAPGTSNPKAYWYITYTVTNKTGAEQNFLPLFEVVTEDGTSYRANFALHQEVFDAIKKREGNALLEPDTKISGPIRQGEDQAKDGVIIWEEPKTSLRQFQIYAGGLCGEHIFLKDDSGQIIKNAKGDPVILRKTLELAYQVRGGIETVIDPNQIQAKPENWVMR